MGMQLNVESDEAYELASELAELTGESLTTAVTAALRERLERERNREERKRRIRSIAAEIRARVGPGVRSKDHNNLYDEDGLPI